MKLRHTLLVLGLSAMAAAGFEMRVFKNAAKTKSFEGQLTAYSASKGMVQVRLKNGKKVNFKIDLLSAEDQKYIEENKDALAVAQNVVISMKGFKEEATTKKTDTERTTTTPVGYNIDIRNNSKKEIKNVEVRYTVFYRKDAEKGKGSVARSEGTIDIETLFGNYTDSNQTQPINLVRYIRKKSGGC